MTDLKYSVDHLQGSAKNRLSARILAKAMLTSLVLASVAALTEQSPALANLSANHETASSASALLSAKPKKPIHDLLSGVSCLPTTCVAVGSYVDAVSGNTLPLLEQGTSQGWSISTSAGTLPLGGTLNDVACVRPSTCMAVGMYGSGRDTAGNDNFATLVERWNGSGWKKIGSPNVHGSTDSRLEGVYCFGASECLAVGEYVDSLGNTYPFVEQWNGRRWSISRSPVPGRSAVPSSVEEYLHAVTCVSGNTCFAVGYDSSHSRSLIEQWNGAQWVIVGGPPVHGKTDPTLQGATCTSVSCLAVGASTEPKKLVSAPLIDQFDGAQWSVVRGAAYGPGAESLSGLACLGSARCFAVGQKTTTTGYIKGLIEEWDGKQWSNIPKPNPSSARAGRLSSVSCAAKTCFSVGEYQTPKKQFTLIEEWKSGAWTLAPSPNL